MNSNLFGSEVREGVLDFPQSRDVGEQVFGIHEILGRCRRNPLKAIAPEVEIVESFGGAGIFLICFVKLDDKR